MNALQHAEAAYRAWRMHDAVEAAQSACDLQPKNAAAWHLLARATRHIGLRGASDAAFGRAAELDSSLPLPHRARPERFAQLAASVRPDGWRVRSLPVEADGVSPDAQSLRQDRELVLYSENIEIGCGSEEALRSALATLLAPL